MTTILMNKTYDGESIVDMERDVSECIDSNYNAAAGVIPQGEHGFHQGTFVVTVTWISDSE